jgi:hypothetical protein
MVYMRGDNAGENTSMHSRHGWNRRASRLSCSPFRTLQWRTAWQSASIGRCSTRRGALHRLTHVVLVRAAAECCITLSTCATGRGVFLRGRFYGAGGPSESSIHSPASGMRTSARQTGMRFLHGKHQISQVLSANFHNLVRACTFSRIHYSAFIHLVGHVKHAHLARDTEYGG